VRFVRAFTCPETGALEHVLEREVPFPEDTPIHAHRNPADNTHKRRDFVVHELGVAEHFDACHPITGAPCTPAAHLFQRLEAVPALELADGAVGLGRFRPKAGADAIPTFHQVPTSLPGILGRIRAGGSAAVHERVGYWLHFMGVLTAEQMAAAGIRPIPLSVAMEFDAMRLARDPSVGSRAEIFKRAVRMRAAIARRKSSTLGGSA
jgi:hypothetical protein